MNDFLNTILAEQEAKTSTSALTKGFLAGAAGLALCLALATYEQPTTAVRTSELPKIEAKTGETLQTTRSFDVRSEHEVWELYISTALADGRFSRAQVQQVRKIFREVSTAIGRPCAVPITQSLGDRALEIAWDNGQMYVDAEIQPDGRFHWYFRDRNSGLVSGTDTEACDSVTPDFLTRIIEVVSS